MNSAIPTSFVSHASRRSLNNDRDRNIFAAVFSAKLIVLMILALALPNWYYLKGGGCPHQSLGTEHFLYTSYVQTLTIPADVENISYSKLAYYVINDDMKNCLTTEIVMVQRVVIGLCFLTIFFGFYQLYLDGIGVKNHSLNCTRRCGLGSILSVITVVVIIGLCYYTSNLMEQQQDMTKMYPTIRVEVTFGISYYLIAYAGIVAVLTTALSLFKCDHLSRNVDVSLLLDDNQEEETFSISLPHSRTWAHLHELRDAYLSNLPSPPPYTP